MIDHQQMQKATALLIEKELWRIPISSETGLSWPYKRRAHLRRQQKRSNLLREGPVLATHTEHSQTPRQRSSNLLRDAGALATNLQVTPATGTSGFQSLARRASPGHSTWFIEIFPSAKVPISSEKRLPGPQICGLERNGRFKVPISNETGQPWPLQKRHERITNSQVPISNETGQPWPPLEHQYFLRYYQQFQSQARSRRPGH